MDDDPDKLQDMGFIQDIVSYTFDEKKIVTFKWISNELNIHINKAKQLLYTFIKHLPEERLKQLHVTYLVGGILPDNKGCRIQVVSEEDLPKIKEQFKLVTSEHIYSVSLKQCLSDLHDLYSVDGGKNKESTRHGAVRCEKSVKRDSGELAAKRKNVQVTIDDGKQWPADKPKQNGTATSDKKKPSNSISSMFAATSKIKTEQTAEPKKEEEPKQESAPAIEKKAPAPKGAQKSAKTAGGGRLAAMFSAQSTKPKPVKKETQEDKTKKPEEKEVTKGRSSLQKETISKSETAESKIKTEKKEVEEKRSKNEKKSKNSKSKQKKRKIIDKDNEKNKKRKRIVIMDSDSSEDDVFGSDDEEDVDEGRCPSPSINDEEMEESKEEDKGGKGKEPEAEREETSKRGRARLRKVVNKTFVDEEGYIVSKKVVEFVSCSEDEEEEKENESKKPESKNEQKAQKGSPQKISPPEKKKQATLMSFFKRS